MGTAGVYPLITRFSLCDPQEEEIPYRRPSAAWPPVTTLGGVIERTVLVCSFQPRFRRRALKLDRSHYLKPRDPHSVFLVTCESLNCPFQRSYLSADAVTKSHKCLRLDSGPIRETHLYHWRQAWIPMQFKPDSTAETTSDGSGSCSYRSPRAAVMRSRSPMLALVVTRRLAFWIWHSSR